SGVDDLRAPRRGFLADRSVLLEDQHLAAGQRELAPDCETDHAGADDDDIELRLHFPPVGACTGLLEWCVGGARVYMEVFDARQRSAGVERRARAFRRSNPLEAVDRPVRARSAGHRTAAR